MPSMLRLIKKSSITQIVEQDCEESQKERDEKNQQYLLKEDYQMSYRSNMCDKQARQFVSKTKI